MLYFWLTLLILLNALCLVLVLFALPGNWLIVIFTCLFAWWRWEEGVFSAYTLIAITILATVAELCELLGGMGGARKAGGRFLASVGALLGAITGAIVGTFLIPLPFFGTLLGCCLGAGAGAWLCEMAGGRQMKESARTGLGAGLGQFFGLSTKIALGFTIWLIVTIAAFWP